jgi:VWFA-related protein
MTQPQSQPVRVLALLTLGTLTPLALAQSAAPAPSPARPPAMLQARTETVYVDVVVRAHNQPVHGLTQQDFTLLQDGHPEQLRFFQEHDGTHPAAPASQHLAAGELSNLAPDGTPGASINILLFDLLNTPPVDQLYARRQMLRFLAALPPGQQTALFVLSGSLRMLQGFTASSDALIHAAQQIDPKNLTLIRSSTEQQQDADWLANLAAAMGASSGRDPGGTIAHLRADQVREDALSQDERARRTLGALATLAQATSGYAGRKNLLWLSESFPMDTGAALSLSLFDRQGTETLRETEELIAATDIAVYPISLETIQPEGIAADSSGMVSSYSSGISTIDDQYQARQQLHVRMDDIAHETGGRAFYGTNDLSRALEESMSDGASYYTLAFDPQQAWDGRYRKLHVQLACKGCTLEYRRGYFALASEARALQPEVAKPNLIAKPTPPPQPARSSPRSPQDQGALELAAAMRPSTPQATALRLRAKLVPSSGTDHPPRLYGLLNPADIAFSAGLDGSHRAQLRILLLEFASAEESLVVTQSAGLLQLDLDSAKYDKALREGVPFTLDLPIKAAARYARIGLLDSASHHIGTLDFRLPTPPAAAAQTP